MLGTKILALMTVVVAAASALPTKYELQLRELLLQSQKRDKRCVPNPSDMVPLPVAAGFHIEITVGSSPCSCCLITPVQVVAQILDILPLVGGLINICSVMTPLNVLTGIPATVVSSCNGLQIYSMSGCSVNLALSLLAKVSGGIAGGVAGGATGGIIEGVAGGATGGIIGGVAGGATGGAGGAAGGLTGGAAGGVIGGATGGAGGAASGLTGGVAGGVVGGATGGVGGAAGGLTGGAAGGVIGGATGGVGGAAGGLTGGAAGGLTGGLTGGLAGR